MHNVFESKMHVKWTRYVIAILTVTVGLSTCESLEVLEGSSVTLNITSGRADKESVRVLKWIFYRTTIVEYFEDVNFDPYYEARVVFYEGNFSLLLKNLMRNDTGYYKAEKRSFAGLIATVAEYNITVLEKKPEDNSRKRTALYATAGLFAFSCVVLGSLAVLKRGDPQD